MLPIKHSKEPLGKGLEAHPTAFSMQRLGLYQTGFLTLTRILFPLFRASLRPISSPTSK